MPELFLGFATGLDPLSYCAMFLRQRDLLALRRALRRRLLWLRLQPVISVRESKNT